MHALLNCAAQYVSAAPRVGASHVGSSSHALILAHATRAESHRV